MYVYRSVYIYFFFLVQFWAIDGPVRHLKYVLWLGHFKSVCGKVEPINFERAKVRTLLSWEIWENMFAQILKVTQIQCSCCGIKFAPVWIIIALRQSSLEVCHLNSYCSTSIAAFPYQIMMGNDNWIHLELCISSIPVVKLNTYTW